MLLHSLSRWNFSAKFVGGRIVFVSIGSIISVRYGPVMPAKCIFGHEMKKQTVKHVAIAVEIKHILMIPEQAKLNFFTKYPPRNVPPPPAGTVINPIINAAKMAVTLNWFSICFGRKAAKPAIIRPSDAPAKFMNINVGFCNNANMALCISRSLEYCLVFVPLCASDIFTCCSFSDPICWANASKYRDDDDDGRRECNQRFLVFCYFTTQTNTTRYRRDRVYRWIDRMLLPMATTFSLTW